MTAEKKIIDGSVIDSLDDEDVRDYLKLHADFFERHPDMLDYLHITHSSGNAVSLVEKQVSVLRERNMEMRRRLNTLTDNARDNDRLYESTRALVLELLDAGNAEDLGRAFHASMQADFGVEHASMILFGDPGNSGAYCRVEAADAARIEIGALLKNRKATCGVLRKEELSYLFPGAGDIGSAAVMPLHKGADLGVIAVGSSDAEHYTSSMGTLFLGHIADVLVRLLPRLGKDVP
jgi:uncharacterized protein YigA (DUF484 family)